MMLVRIQIALGVVWCVLAGCDEGQFLCGTPSGWADNATRVCDRAAELCVCATYSCAVPSQRPECTSGYEYVDTPFATEAVAATCVEMDDLGTAIDQRETVACKPTADATAEDAAAIDAAAADAVAIDAATGAGS